MDSKTLNPCRLATAVDVLFFDQVAMRQWQTF